MEKNTDDKMENTEELMQKALIIHAEIMLVVHGVKTYYSIESVRLRESKDL